MCLKFGLEALNSAFRPNVQRKSVPKLINLAKAQSAS